MRRRKSKRRTSMRMRMDGGGDDFSIRIQELYEKLVAAWLVEVRATKKLDAAAGDADDALAGSQAAALVNISSCGLQCLALKIWNNVDLRDPKLSADKDAATKLTESVKDSCTIAAVGAVTAASAAVMRVLNPGGLNESEALALMAGIVGQLSESLYSYVCFEDAQSSSGTWREAEVLYTLASNKTRGTAAAAAVKATVVEQTRDQGVRVSHFTATNRQFNDITFTVSETGKANEECRIEVKSSWRIPRNSIVSAPCGESKQFEEWQKSKGLLVFVDSQQSQGYVLPSGDTTWTNTEYGPLMKFDLAQGQRFQLESLAEAERKLTELIGHVNKDWCLLGPEQFSLGNVNGTRYTDTVNGGGRLTNNPNVRFRGQRGRAGDQVTFYLNHQDPPRATCVRVVPHWRDIAALRRVARQAKQAENRGTGLPVPNWRAPHSYDARGQASWK